MSAIPIKDADDVTREVDVFVRTDGAKQVEMQAMVPVDPADGSPLDLATEATIAALLVAANAIKVAAESLSANALTDLQLRALPVAIAQGYDSKDFWPQYTGSDETNQRPSIDPGGNLLVRGAITTDEGTFRANFANTSLAVAIGSVTVAGAVVNGAGFLASDIHYKDYFKLDADAESAWTAIESIDSDTQLTLRVAYPGATSGAASRALMRPVTGSGGSIAVASGVCTLTAGTTANAITRITRDVDYAPMVYRGRVSISQRIANQTIRIGLTESFTVADRWFARFKVDGTVGTTVVCETGRNPTTTPSAAETESTTVTLPGGITTANNPEYRVEMLTEKVAFFINGVLVALHTRSIPAQYDLMEAGVTCINGAVAPASSTTIAVDYVTGKNHNKAEVGIMSDIEQIVAASAPLQSFSYTQAGVIAINTVLMTIDCSQFRHLSIQCVSMGTTGVAIAEWSNDPASGIWSSSFNLMNASAIQNTISSANTYKTEVYARYFRLRLSTATTAGTTTFAVTASQSPATSLTQVVGSVGLSSGTGRVGFVAAHGVWYDDSATVLAANATLTSSSRDLVAAASATTFTSASTMAQELRVSAESDQSGTLWLEVSRDNTNWRRVKSVATAAVTGGGQYAEIIHRPSWRYVRVGFTNGATLQTRFSIGSILMAA
jgi:hypothetical protein